MQSQIKVGDIVSISSSNPTWVYCCFETGEILSIQGRFATVKGSVFGGVAYRQVEIERLTVLRQGAPLSKVRS